MTKKITPDQAEQAQDGCTPGALMYCALAGMREVKELEAGATGRVFMQRGDVALCIAGSVTDVAETASWCVLRVYLLTAHTLAETSCFRSDFGVVRVEQ